MSTEKPYKIIEGTHQRIAAFEAEVAEAMEAGYALAGDLVVKTSGAELKFFQPVFLGTFMDEEEEDEDDEDEAEED